MGTRLGRLGRRPSLDGSRYLLLVATFFLATGPLAQSWGDATPVLGALAPAVALADAEASQPAMSMAASHRDLLLHAGVSLPNACGANGGLGIDTPPAQSTPTAYLVSNDLNVDYYRVWVQPGWMPFSDSTQGQLSWTDAAWANVDHNIAAMMQHACVVVELSWYGPHDIPNTSTLNPVQLDLSDVVESAPGNPWQNFQTDYTTYLSQFFAHWNAAGYPPLANFQLLNEPNLQYGHAWDAGKTVQVHGIPPSLEQWTVQALQNAMLAAGVVGNIWGPELADTYNNTGNGGYAACGRLYAGREQLYINGRAEWAYDSSCYLQYLECGAQSCPPTTPTPFVQDVSVISAHVYCTANWPGSIGVQRYQNSIQTYTTDQTAYGGVSKPVVVDEYGFVVQSSNGADANAQAGYIVDASIAIMASGGNSAALWAYDDQGGQFGLVDPNGNPRPSYNAFKNAVALLQESLPGTWRRYAGSNNCYAWSVALSLDNETLWAGWQTGACSAVKVGHPKQQLVASYDAYGDATPLVKWKGMLHLSQQSYGDTVFWITLGTLGPRVTVSAT